MKDYRELKCPTCNHELQVNTSNESSTCSFCPGISNKLLTEYDACYNKYLTNKSGGEKD